MSKKKNPFAEPEWNWSDEMPAAEMEWKWVRALHWYRCNADPKKKKDWVLKYVETSVKGEKASDYRGARKSLYEDAGGLCRIKSKGCVNDCLDRKITEALVAIKADSKKQISIITPNKPIISVKDRVADQVSDYMGEVNNYIDNYLAISSIVKKDWFNLEEWLKRNSVKSMQTTEIMKEIKSMHSEAKSAYFGEDPQLVEAYDFLTNKKLNRYVEFLGNMVQACEKHIKAVRPTSKRVKKNMDPEQMVKSLPYKKAGEEVNLFSVDPEKIIGADALFVYNETSRFMCVYQSRLGNGGLVVKGASIEHFDSERSFMKKISNPDHVIRMIRGHTKKNGLQAIEGINTIKRPVRPRLNANCLIVEVH
jgi:hypothetical protein